MWHETTGEHRAEQTRTEDDPALPGVTLRYQHRVAEDGPKPDKNTM